MKIRKLETHKEYLAAEDLQRKVFGFADREVIPLNELVVAQKNGGIVFGTFEGQKLIGFCFGVPALRDGQFFHYSRMLGILQEYQGKNIGFKMKLFQRRFVISQGLSLIRWTFDPLQSKNAYLNIEKLGVLIDEYIINLYAQSTSKFNKGLETDRFIPKWFIKSPRVVSRLINGPVKHKLEEYVPSFLTRVNSDGFPEPGKSISARSRKVSVEIPVSIDELKSSSLSLATTWRTRTRLGFLNFFKKGFRVDGFAWGDKTAFYLLQK